MDYKFKPSNLPEELDGSKVLAAYFTARREDVFNSFGKRLKVIAHYGDGQVSLTQTAAPVMQVREDQQHPDVFHVLTTNCKRELVVVAI